MSAASTPKPPRVLVVDDIPSVIRLLELSLRLEGWEVVTATVGEQTFQMIEREDPDVVLLEVILPGISGFEVLRRIHDAYDVPVVFVTSQGTEADRAYGFELGAADYITKPFSPSELSVRLNAVLQIKTYPTTKVLHCGALEIDIEKMVARRGNEVISLGTNEWAILYSLAQSVGEAVPASMLVAVWGGEYANEVKYLETWIGRLRKKIERAELLQPSSRATQPPATCFMLTVLEPRAPRTLRTRGAFQVVPIHRLCDTRWSAHWWL